VLLGGAMVANAVRRIALGELTAPGASHADLDELIAGRRQAPLSPPPAVAPAPSPAGPPRLPAAAATAPSREEIRFVVTCASSAPSGGNMQPWRFEADGNVIRA
jgi:hypothetical protein